MPLNCCLITNGTVSRGDDETVFIQFLFILKDLNRLYKTYIWHAYKYKIRTQQKSF